MGSVHPWRVREEWSRRLSQAGDIQGSPVPRGRNGTAGTEGTAGKAASKAAPGVRLRKPPKGQGITAGIQGGMATGTCHRAELSPLPAHPRALRTPPEMAPCPS